MTVRYAFGFVLGVEVAAVMSGCTGAGRAQGPGDDAAHVLDSDENAGGDGNGDAAAGDVGEGGDEIVTGDPALDGDSGAEATFSLEITRSGSGAGTISGMGLSCGEVCTGAFPAGTSITLTAQPLGVAVFAGWTGGGCSGTAACTVALSADTIIDARFVLPAGAWSPPAGIPRPEFGIDETYRMYDEIGSRNSALTYAPSAAGGFLTHYVDSSSPLSTDDGNPTGSIDKPRKSVPTPLPPGSIVEVANEGELKSVLAEGSAAQPVFIRGSASAGNTASIIKSEAFQKGSRYVILEDLVFKGVQGLLLRQNSHHVAMRLCEVTGLPVATVPTSINALAADSSWVSGETISHVVFYANKIHDNGVALGWPPPTTGGAQGIQVGASSYRVWIVDNEIYRNAEDGIHVINYNDRGDPRYIYIGRNKIYDNGENAVDIKQAFDVVVSSNDIYHYRPISVPPYGNVSADGSDGAAIVINNEPPNSRVWIINSTIHDSTIGIRSQGDDTYYIVGNLFYDIKQDTASAVPNGGYAVVASTAKELHLASNTVVSSEGGFRVRNGGAYFIQNNLMGDILISSNYHMYLNRTEGISYELSNNLVYGSAGARIYNLNTYPCSSCLLDTSAGLAGDGHSLASGSAAIDAGFESSVYATFEQLYTLNVREDIGGNARPQGGQWDIGAFEYK